jgi:hypothetical protein
MGIQSIISFTCLLFIDYQIFTKIKYFIYDIFRLNNRNYSQIETSTEAAIPYIVPITTVGQVEIVNEQDEDVKGEIERIQSTPNHVLMQTDVLVLNQVAKIYQRSFRAVDELTLGVKRRECFGLLGVNGA